ncbi:MAG: hypothetical protein MR441_03995, partial [Bacteroidales bacterium]|nr:hypothetical protein [Bacteroidales bacterium]
MTNKIEIGINQRIPISLLEMALLATLEGQGTPEYFAELASTEYQGENRIRKSTYVMGRLTNRNPLMPFLQGNKDSVISALRSKTDRPIILAALINSAYSFGYDLTAILGKYLHVQTQVTTALLASKLSEKYGSNRSLPNAMNCIIPMLIEAGFFHRPRPGFFEAIHHSGYSQLALEAYK